VTTRSHLEKRPGRFVVFAVPLASYSVVMGTGIVSVALLLDQQPLLAGIWLAVTSAVWVLLGGAMIGRMVGDRDGLAAEARFPTALTVVAGTAVLGSRLFSYRVEGLIDAFLIVAVVLAIVLLAALLRHRDLPRSGSAFMVTVSLESLATLAALATTWTQARWLFYAALAACALGLALYPFLLFRFDLREIVRGAGDHWIAGGALAISALATAECSLGAERLGGLHEAVLVLRDASVVTWAASVAWLALLIGGELASPRGSYDMRRWATVFPVGMYAASSFQVARAANVPPLHTFAAVVTWIAVAVWLAVTAGMVRSLAGSDRGDGAASRQHSADAALPFDGNRPVYSSPDRRDVMSSEMLTIKSLEEWVRSGAYWRLVDISKERAVVDLLTCTGEPVERVESADADVISYLRTAPGGD
jgi:tellurite resistance protein TehA-like permease